MFLVFEKVLRMNYLIHYLVKGFLSDLNHFFESHHISSKWSRTVYTYYGVQSVAVIEDNPYTLLRVAPDMLFGTADTLAEHFRYYWQ